MKTIRTHNVFYKCLISLLCASSGACAQTPAVDDKPKRTTNPYADAYEDVHRFDQHLQWGPFNVHDPQIIDDGEFFYCYSTDVAWGQEVERAGVQIRRSRDLVDWEFRGWASDGRPKQGLEHINANGGRAFENVWAPCAIKVGDEYRVYYSQSSHVPKNSEIGLLTGPTPEGPFTEAGLVVTSNNDVHGTNAIDPAVIVTPEGEHWMYYGSAWDGAYALQLDPETGLALKPGDLGQRVIQRGNTDGHINGNIEAPEVIYHPGFKKYYLFIAYDWLFTKYNVRVARGDSPTGPFFGFNGEPVNDHQDNGPMILAPYRFENHPGWQGVSHCTVFERDGQYYLASQGRPSNSAHYMIMHARKVYWTDGGWPVVSPQRLASVEGGTIEREDLLGTWELIDFEYEVVPGFAREQTDPGFGTSQTVTLLDDGSVNGETQGRWQFDNDAVLLRLDGDPQRRRLIVDRAWDWENQCETIIFTGLNADGYPLWGKQLQTP